MVSTTPAEPVAILAAGVVDTGGNFVIGVVDTGGTLRNEPNVIFRGLVEDDSWNKPEVTNLVTLSLLQKGWAWAAESVMLGC